MELYTLASAAALVGCSPSRLKGWMDKGLIPDKRIQFGTVRARVIDQNVIPRLGRVLQGIEEEGLNVRTAFDLYFDE